MVARKSNANHDCCYRCERKKWRIAWRANDARGQSMLLGESSIGPNETIVSWWSIHSLMEGFKSFIGDNFIHHDHSFPSLARPPISLMLLSLVQWFMSRWSRIPPPSQRGFVMIRVCCCWPHRTEGTPVANGYHYLSSLLPHLVPLPSLFRPPDRLLDRPPLLLSQPISNTEVSAARITTVRLVHHHQLQPILSLTSFTQEEHPLQLLILRLWWRPQQAQWQQT